LITWAVNDPSGDSRYPITALTWVVILGLGIRTNLLISLCCNLTN